MLGKEIRRRRSSPSPCTSCKLFSKFSLLHCRVKAKVIVTPKAAVLDPQGAAVRDAMRHLGMEEVKSVRIGKYLEIELEGKGADTTARLEKVCHDLLSNPVIEDYELLEQ